MCMLLTLQEQLEEELHVAEATPSPPPPLPTMEELLSPDSDSSQFDANVSFAGFKQLD